MILRDIYFSRPANQTLPSPPNAPSDSDPTGFTRVVNGCNLASIPDPGKGVVIVSSTSMAVANYQLWRTSMIIMKQLMLQANAIPQPRTGATPPDVTAGLAVAGQVVTVVQGILGLFASNQSYISVTGTIQDQALMNGVARQLRNLNIKVLMPDTYISNALGGISDSSPFLNSLSALIAKHNQIQLLLQVDQAILNKSSKLQADKITVAADQDKLKQTGPNDPQRLPIQNEISNTQAEITVLSQQLSGVPVDDIQKTVYACQSVLTAIETFLGNLTGSGLSIVATTPPAIPAAPTPAPASPAAPVPAASITSAPATGVPPLVAILLADGLAQSIGFRAPDGMYEPPPGWHVLWLKALESGGGLTTESNIFGTKVHFSGGAVASYDLFQFNGSLTCSGNVMAYAGYVKAKDFRDEFDALAVDPRKQLIFLRGGCAIE